jgi:hypothetical protein
MNNTTIQLAQFNEDILGYGFSHEAIEAAARWTATEAPVAQNFWISGAIAWVSGAARAGNARL